MSSLELHGLAMKSPMAHTLHVAGVVLPGRQKASAGHPVALDGSRHENPGGHGLWTVDPAGQ
jgi:hypothetical protein